MKAHDLVSPGVKAVAVLTYGPHFSQHSDGTGSTGNWPVKARSFDLAHSANPVTRVIIFHSDGQARANVYEARISETTRVASTGAVAKAGKRKRDRYMIHFVDLRYVGRTPYNFAEFTGSAKGARNSVKYITGH